jgi:hypothetical protein
MPKFENDLSIIMIPYLTDRINTAEHKVSKDIVKKTPKHYGHSQQLPAYCNYPLKSG